MAWRRLELDVAVCKVPLGLETQTFGAVDPAQKVLHWADPEAAHAWARDANHAAQDPAAFRAADASESYAQQYAFLRGLGQRIMNFYNAANVPWYNDPEARRLWRKYWAGPTQPGDNPLYREFQPPLNYNDEWYRALGGSTEGNTWPKVHPEKQFFGINSKRAREMFLRWYPRGPAAAQHWNDLVLAERPLLLPDPQTTPGAREPDDYRKEPWLLEGVENLLNAWPESPHPEATTLGEYYDARLPGRSAGYRNGPPRTWHDVGFDVAAPSPVPSFENGVEWIYDIAPNAPLRIAGALRWDYEWLQEWAQALITRSVLDVILCSRGYAIWRNQQTSTVIGSSALAKIIGVLGEVEKAKMEGSAEAKAVAASAVALGAAAGGWGALIGAGVGAVVAISDALGAFRRGLDNKVGRDDVGRYKPVFERGWLSGLLSLTDASGRPVWALRLPAAPPLRATDPPPPVPPPTAAERLAAEVRRNERAKEEKAFADQLAAREAAARARGELVVAGTGSPAAQAAGAAFVAGGVVLGAIAVYALTTQPQKGKTHP